MRTNIREGALLFLVALSFYLVWKQGENIKSITRNNTRISLSQCRRTREFSPPIVKFYQKHHILDEQQIRDYIRTIPTHC